MGVLYRQSQKEICHNIDFVHCCKQTLLEIRHYPIVLDFLKPKIEEYGLMIYWWYQFNHLFADGICYYNVMMYQVSSIKFSKNKELDVMITKNCFRQTIKVNDLLKEKLSNINNNWCLVGKNKITHFKKVVNHNKNRI